MLGLYLKEPSDLGLKEFVFDTPIKDDEVKIRLVYGGICGSDISVFNGRLPHAVYPIRPGHELVGIVLESGKDTDVKIGNRVIVQPNSYCGTCEYCESGRTNICPNKESLGVNTNGGFSEEFVISAKYLLEVPDTLSDEKAVLVEPLSVIVHALKKVDIKKDTNVAIIGCGTEGMLSIALTEYLGANITAIDINQEKLDKVKSSYHNIKTLKPDEVELGLYDVVVEAAGVSAAFEQGVELVKPGGAMVLIGMAPEATIPVIKVVRKEITLYGSIIYNVPEDFLRSMNLLKDNKFNVDPVISKIYHFTDFEKAYKDAISGQFGKIVLNFKEE
ncbi:zinc-dependent alcohol dehydrogenase [Salipaludibacillus sp. CF4.18]|uniref:zinc-dependent alcohol dehydrogenase n=1 Tax=Salipaludibacillus sp. CF4.18 TaxID=3373081 RepID=UPI003EE4CA23